MPHHHEYPLPITPDHAPASPDAVLGIRRNDLKPEVRAYADNLRDQVRQIFADHGVKTVDEFSAAARTKKIPLEQVREVHALLKKLREVVETGEITEWKELHAIGAALVVDARARTPAFDDPNKQSLLFTHLATIEAAIGGTPDADIAAAKQAIQSMDEWEQGAKLCVLTEAELAMGRDPKATIDAAVDVVQHHSSESILGKLYTLLAKAGHDVPRNTLRRIRDVHVCIQTCVDIASVYQTLGKDLQPFIDEAEETMSRGPSTSINEYESSQRLLAIAKIEAQQGRVKDATDTALRISELSPHVAALADVVDAQVRAGVDATETIQLMKRAAQRRESKKSGTLRGGLFLDIIHAEARAGLPYENELQKVKAMAQDGGASGPFLFREIATVEHALGRDPTETLNRARKAIHRLSDPQEEAMEYIHLAEREGTLGRDPAPTLTLARASALLNTGTNAPDRDQQLEGIVRVYAKTHAVQRAHTALADIETPYRQESALVMIAVAESEMGDVRSAEKTIQRITEMDTQIRAWQYLALLYAEAGHDPRGYLATAREIIAMLPRGDNPNTHEEVDYTSLQYEHVKSIADTGAALLKRYSR